MFFLRIKQYVNKTFRYFYFSNCTCFYAIFIFLLFILAIFDTRQNGFFLQKRIGQFGKPFTIYKLKTFGYSKKNPVSKFGDFLRNSKLDEVPQLWNVLLGNMSFVGLRPDIAGYYDLLEGENRKILKLKHGLTSLASIKHAKEDDLLRLQLNPLTYNDEIIFPDKVRMNLDYYYNHNFLGDLKIQFNTFFR